MQVTRAHLRAIGAVESRNDENMWFITDKGRFMTEEQVRAEEHAKNELVFGTMVTFWRASSRGSRWAANVGRTPPES